MQNLDQLVNEAGKAINESADLRALDDVRVRYLGKKGLVTEQLKSLGKLSAEDRPAAGQKINAAKQRISEMLDARRTVLEDAHLAKELASETVDVTMPGRGELPGGLHPATRIMDRIADLFRGMGFGIETGPEIEDEFHNFDALNFKPGHPARADMDTFYLKREFGKKPLLLRTHTSPVQIRAMKKRGAPIRIIAIGRTFRHDYDVTHTPMFHQVEGLLIDKGVSMAHLRGILETFLKNYFERDDIELRFRPSYFPFVEPGAEVDISCLFCSGKGCRVCKQTGWIEILGCGMVHPNVLKAVDIDPEIYTGWAFGMGVERVGMLRYGINDIRLNYDNDLRFLKQFN